MSTTTTYTVYRYSDGEEIGTADLTAEQFTNYMAMSQQPEGIIRLGILPHDYYDLGEEFRGEGENTTVYIDR